MNESEKEPPPPINSRVELVPKSTKITKFKIMKTECFIFPLTPLTFDKDSEVGKEGCRLVEDHMKDSICLVQVFFQSEILKSVIARLNSLILDVPSIYYIHIYPAKEITMTLYAYAPFTFGFIKIEKWITSLRLEIKGYHFRSEFEVKHEE